MTTINLEGYISDDHELVIKLPEDFPVGKVKLTVESALENEASKPIKFHALTLGEILDSGLVGAWADQGITSGQDWVDRVRREEEERRKWPTDS